MSKKAAKQETVPVFVYGTLKEGFPLNESYMDKSKKVGNDSLAGFALFSLGFYPGLMKLHADEVGGGVINARVLGEVWDMPLADFLKTKAMEEAVGYRTEEVTTDAGRKAFAFILGDLVAGNYSWRNNDNTAHSMRAPVGKVVITKDDIPF